ncbi:MAG: hypothetical protein J5I94_28090 [Phaeodactylibacter sp.]|nr:hypothetical protein [Phaeodactylibacter sp.]
MGLPQRILLLLAALLPLYLPAQPAPDAGAQKVYAGIYLMNLYDLNINEHSFNADFYLWFKWKGERSPMNIEFVNSVEKWGFTQADFSEEPELLPDGYWYNGMRIEGRFYHPFALYDFPLDRHQLRIHIENVDYPQDSLVYLPDSTGAFIRDGFQMPGWTVEGCTMGNRTNRYQSNFGESRKASVSFSNFTFELSISRPLNYFLLKLMLPLLIVIIASLGALFIHPALLDARISLPIGGLLTSVFLQQSYNSALPDVGYMVLMDKIYLLGYALIVCIMLRAILVGNKVGQLKKKADIPAIKRTDRRLAWVLLALFTAGALILVF